MTQLNHVRFDLFKKTLWLVATSTNGFLNIVFFLHSVREQPTYLCAVAVLPPSAPTFLFRELPHSAAGPQGRGSATVNLKFTAFEASVQVGGDIRQVCLHLSAPFSLPLCLSPLPDRRRRWLGSGGRGFRAPGELSPRV